MSKRRKRRSDSGVGLRPTIVVLVVASIVLVAGVMIAIGPSVSSLASARSTGNDFMNALQSNDYTKAFEMITPSYQSVFNEPVAMKNAFTGAGWEPSSFSISRAELAPSGKTVVNGMGTFSGATKFFTIFMLKAGDTWQVTGYMTENNPPTPIPGA